MSFLQVYCHSGNVIHLYKLPHKMLLEPSLALSKYWINIRQKGILEVNVPHRREEPRPLCRSF